VGRNFRSETVLTGLGNLTRILTFQKTTLLYFPKCTYNISNASHRPWRPRILRGGHQSVALVIQDTCLGRLFIKYQLCVDQPSLCRVILERMKFVLPEKSPRQIRFDKRFGSIVHFVRYPNLHLRSDCLIDRQLGVATPAADVVDYLAERQVC
jgi:hypothetical protein